MIEPEYPKPVMDALDVIMDRLPTQAAARAEETVMGALFQHAQGESLPLLMALRLYPDLSPPVLEYVANHSAA